MKTTKFANKNKNYQIFTLKIKLNAHFVKQNKREIKLRDIRDIMN